MTNEPLQESLWRNEIANRVAAHRSRTLRDEASTTESPSAASRTRSQELSQRALDTLRRRVESRLALEEAERREREELERFFAEFDKPLVPAIPMPQSKPTNVVQFPTAPAMSAAAAAAAPALAPVVADQLTIFEAPAEDPAQPAPEPSFSEREPERQAQPKWMPPLRLDEHLDYDYREAPSRPESEFDLPLKVAPFALRCWAGVLDASLVLASTAAFCGIFYFLMHEVPKQKTMLAFSVLVLFAFWTIYNVLFFAYSGATPGLKAMRLGISDYHDGVPSVTRRIGRAISIVLTSFSLGVGFAWALFDEDRLGWHDRMSKTFPRQLA